MQQVGRPVFYALLDLDLPVDEWEAAGEYLRARIAEHIALHGSVATEDIENYAAHYEQARAVVQ